MVLRACNCACGIFNARCLLRGPEFLPYSALRRGGKLYLHESSPSWNMQKRSRRHGLLRHRNHPRDEAARVMMRDIMIKRCSPQECHHGQRALPKPYALPLAGARRNWWTLAREQRLPCEATWEARLNANNGTEMGYQLTDLGKNARWMHWRNREIFLVRCQCRLMFTVTGQTPVCATWQITRAPRSRDGPSGASPELELAIWARLLTAGRPS